MSHDAYWMYINSNFQLPFNYCVSYGSLYWITKAAGEKSGSALLKANAWHHRGDAVSTIVALIGVGKASHALRCSTLQFINSLDSFQ